MPYQTHGLRHDVDALFAKLQAEDKWLMVPCVVIDEGAYGEDGEIRLARSAAELLAFRDACQVICGWPGARRQDVFEFSVGQFRSAVAGRSCSPQEATMDGVCEQATESGAVSRGKLLVEYLAALKAGHSSRELSCAFTHAEEALMWLEKIAATPAAQPAEAAE